MALSAWWWVDGETCRLFVFILRKAETPATAMSHVWRITPPRPCQRIKKRTQYR